MKRQLPAHAYCICLVVFLLFTACTANPTANPAPPLTTSPIPSATTAQGLPAATQAATQALDTRLPAETLSAAPSAAIPPSATAAKTGAKATETPIPAAHPTQPPTVESTQITPAGPQLAFLKKGDIWLLDSPQSKPYQLTLAGDILSYAWSPDGSRLAAFNGHSLCFFQRDGSVRSACQELGLKDTQTTIERRLLWSPDQRWIVLWNPVNPQDQDSIGWLVVALDTTNAMYRIQDPVDWGAALAPNNDAGGFTGQPLFLPDSRLIGTLTHHYLCGSGGCHYQLYEFDLTKITPSFIPFPNKPEEGWSEGRNLILSPDGKILTNYGAFLFSCDSAKTFVDRFDLDTQQRQMFTLDAQAVDSLTISPDQKAAVFAQTAACNQATQAAWNQSCGLSQGNEILAMQRWDLQSGQKQDLSPGLNPLWAPDGAWLAFQSCLAPTDAQKWETSATTPASIYLLDLDGKVLSISDGTMPAWRPR